jgi:hypothetical protein
MKMDQENRMNTTKAKETIKTEPVQKLKILLAMPKCGNKAKIDVSNKTLSRI